MRKSALPNMEMNEKKTVLGILAHVDAGKTTLSEAMLYLTGQISNLGRVDHRDSFLDTEALERSRGITIFSKQANMVYQDLLLQLLDTPGHSDFSAEMERVLGVLDAAVLVISGMDGVQSHTLTLWRLLEHYKVPTLIFCNKMDLAGDVRDRLLLQLHERLKGEFIDYSRIDTATAAEQLATCSDEALLERYMESGKLYEEDLVGLFQSRSFFPVLFGSALKLTGVEELLGAIYRFGRAKGESPKKKEVSADYGARVFKITRDDKGCRLTHIKVTQGSISVRMPVGTEKIDQIRIYNGTKYTTENTAGPGTICALTGLDNTYPGQGLGGETDGEGPLLMPVLAYRVEPAPDEAGETADIHKLLSCLRLLQEEDPALSVVWDEAAGRIQVRLMGEIQLEVLRSILAERFHIAVTFGEGSIVYRETIAEASIGIGHYEPLRHYAEVHLLLEPAEPGSGLTFESRVREDDLDLNWQRLILTHLAEKRHVGVLTGSAIWDMKITLIAGRAHQKHTEGGDFRQATYRAVRNGLMKTKNVLLEPIYRFTLELPADLVGRAMNDITQRKGTFQAPSMEQDAFGNVIAILSGRAPVATLQGYATDVASYSSGRGKLCLQPAGYEPCHNEEEVIAAMGYDPEGDLENPADSVFCAHGAGFVVPWYETQAYAHLHTEELEDADFGETFEAEASRVTQEGERRRERVERDRANGMTSGEMLISQGEINEIMQRTYGSSKREEQRREEARRRVFGTGNAEAIPAKPEKEYQYRPVQKQEEYLLVDGYNIIFAWKDLDELSKVSMDAARDRLIDILCNYQGYVQCSLILVFDAYKVKGGSERVYQKNGIDIVYTKEAETADAYIERTAHTLGKNAKVRVASSDGQVQIIILGEGALRVSAREFREEVDRVNSQIREKIGADA